jgi:hypothetical protein
MHWGDRYLADGHPPPTIWRHTCGHTLTPQVTCDSCVQPVAPGTLVRAADAGHPATTRRIDLGRVSRRLADDSAAFSGAPSRLTSSNPASCPENGRHRIDS